MSCLDGLYRQTITLFNRVSRKGEPTMWIPTVIDGVHLVVRKSSSWDRNGGKNANDVRLHIQYKKSGEDRLVLCRTGVKSNIDGYRKWCDPRSWKRLVDTEGFITFAYGEDNDFDFFMEGVFDEYDGPISDANFEHKGLYGYVKLNYDNVFIVSSAQKFETIPHFEISGR